MKNKKECVQERKKEKKKFRFMFEVVWVYICSEKYFLESFIYIYIYIYFIITLKLIEKLIIDFCFLACHKSESFQFYLTLN